MTGDQQSLFRGRHDQVANTSAAALDSIRPTVGEMRQRVRAYIAEQPDGATCDEVEVALSMPHQTASARICELNKMEQIYDTGERRPTRSGRSARVYKAIKPTPPRCRVNADE